MTTASVEATSADQLAAYFRRNGYVRYQSQERLEEEGYMAYKKGDEIRLTASSKVELRAIRRLLKASGFSPGRPFRKSRQWRQPVYGRAAVARFLALVGEAPDSGCSSTGVPKTKS